MSESMPGTGMSTPGSSELIRVLTHELATPLAALDAALSILTEDRSDADALSSARSAAQHLSLVVARTRSQLDGRPFNGPGGSVSDVFAEIVAMLTPVVAPTGTRLTVDVTESAAPMQVPAWVVRQVVVNLVGNALKYAPGTDVTINASTAGNAETVITVTDGGTGIPADQLDAVTEPGFRLPQHANLPGDGLGLSVCRQLVTSVGGSLQITSAPTGTAVVITLPAL
jgi:signal transduction histidine kinase